jgi:uncharacterized protein (TIGR02598 family)
MLLGEPTSAFEPNHPPERPTMISMKTVQYRIRAFSLVEVSASLAVIAFAFVGVLGLMANGVEQFRGAVDTTVTAQIAQRVLNDAQQAEFSTLIDAAHLPDQPDLSEFTFRAPTIANPSLRYFDEQGNEVLPAQDSGLTPSERLKVVYQVNARIRPQADVPSDFGKREPQLAQVTVQIARHAGQGTLAINTASGSDENLFQLPPGIPVVTYSALVGRNE